MPGHITAVSRTEALTQIMRQGHDAAEARAILASATDQGIVG